MATYPITLAIQALEEQERLAREREAYVTGIVAAPDLTGFTPNRRLLPDFKQVHLRGKNLRFSNFNEAILNEVDATYANFEGAQLEKAELVGAKMRSTFLRGAEFADADLRKANLIDTDLRHAILAGADLAEADIKSADFRRSFGAYPERLTNEEFASMVQVPLEQLKSEQQQQGFCLPEDDMGMDSTCGREARRLWEDK